MKMILLLCGLLLPFVTHANSSCDAMIIKAALAGYDEGVCTARIKTNPPGPAEAIFGSVAIECGDPVGTIGFISSPAPQCEVTIFTTASFITGHERD